MEKIAAEVVQTVDTVEPDAELVAKYNAGYAQFKESCPACRRLFDVLAR